VKQQASVNVCPACGPVPPWSTSTYCRQHSAELWMSYQALRATRPTAISRPAEDRRKIA
jgi:hypothetical protein